MHTKEPCVANKAWFLLEDKKFKSWFKITKPEIIAHIKPAIDTVVNFGVCLLHRRVTENIAKPNAEANPKIRPIIDPVFLFPTAIITIPMAASIIVSQTLNEIFSLRNKKLNKAVMNGIAAKHNNVIAADVFVIDHIKDIIAIARPNPPKIPDKPTFK